MYRWRIHAACLRAQTMAKISRCSHNGARRAAVGPAPSFVPVQVRQLLAVDGTPPSVANILHRLNWVLHKMSQQAEVNLALGTYYNTNTQRLALFPSLLLSTMVY